jgi:hypothetical protein
MIQLILDSTGKIVPEWENEQERLVFRLLPSNVSLSRLLHARMDGAGATVPDGEAVGMVATRYEGDIAREVRVIIELPDDIWDDLADRADDLLEGDSLLDPQDHEEG